MSASSSNQSKETGKPSMPEASSENSDLNCSQLVQLVVDGQATPAQEDYFEQHICQCMSCLENYNLDIAVKKAIMEGCQSKQAPQELIHSIREHLQKAQ